MSYTPSNLSYVGSIDIQSSSNGSTLYNIEIDDDLAADGNFLMFEYKYQPNVTNPPNASITLGYVNIENANFQTGLANIWQLSVPSLDDENNGDMEISMRTYVGLTGSSEIYVSEWTNSLKVYNPPKEQTINKAFYDCPSSDDKDELFVVLNVDPSIDYSIVKFLVAYYYTDINNNIVWFVSNQLSASDFTNNNVQYKLLHVQNFGKVSESPNEQVVYTAIYPVYPFSHHTKNYFSVGHISETYQATPALDYFSPTIPEIIYLDSLDGKASDIQILIEQPIASFAYTFVVEKYILYKKATVNGTLIHDWQPIDIAPDADTTKKTLHRVETENYMISGTKLDFNVQAESTNKTLSKISDVSSKYIFKVASTVIDLKVMNSSHNDVDDTINLDISFKNPSDIGFSPGIKFEIKVANGNNGFNIYFKNYDELATEYNVSIDHIPSPQIGYVSVNLLTEDPNILSALQAGISVEIPYIAANFDPAYIVYNVYNAPYTDNTMDISWSNPISTISDWSVDTYDVYLDVNNSTGTNTTKIGSNLTNNTTNINYTTVESHDSNLSFRVSANLVHNLSLTTYALVSLPVSKNIFKFAKHIGLLSIEYASKFNNNGNKMNVAVSFSNGTNSPDVFSNHTNSDIVVELYNSTYINNGLNNLPPISSKTVDYEDVPNKIYAVKYDNFDYESSGYVVAYIRQLDTNSSAIFYSEKVYVPYQPSELADFSTIVTDQVTHSTNVIVTTQSTLVLGGVINYVDSSSIKHSVNFLIDEIIIKDVGQTALYKYDSTTQLYTYSFSIEQNQFGFDYLTAISGSISISNQMSVVSGILKN
jgi:hypothetical protein